MNNLSFLERHFPPSLIPNDNEMYARNAKELRGVKLCPFLKEMEDQEISLQGRIKSYRESDANHPLTLEEEGEKKSQIEIIARKNLQLKWDSLVGGSAAVIGGIMGGVIGLTILGGGMSIGTHMTVLLNSSMKQSAMDSGRPRINRLISKINKINNKFNDLDITCDITQLTLAQRYFQIKVNRYNFLKEEIPTAQFRSMSSPNGFVNTFVWYDNNGNAHSDIHGVVNTGNEVIAFKRNFERES